MSKHKKGKKIPKGSLREKLINKNNYNKKNIMEESNEMVKKYNTLKKEAKERSLTEEETNFVNKMETLGKIAIKFAAEKKRAIK